MDGVTTGVGSLSMECDAPPVEPNIRRLSIDSVYEVAETNRWERMHKKMEESEMKEEALFKQNPTWVKYLPDYEHMIQHDYFNAVEQGQFFLKTKTVYFTPDSLHCDDEAFREGFRSYCKIQRHRVWENLCTHLDGKNRWEFCVCRIDVLDP